MTKETLKTLKKGQKLKFSKSLMDFFKLEAWNLCTRPNGIESEMDALYYFVRKSIGMRLPHEVEFIEYKEFVGDGPGAMVRIKVGDFTDTTFVDYKDIFKVDKK